MCEELKFCGDQDFFLTDEEAAEAAVRKLVELGELVFVCSAAAVAQQEQPTMKQTQ